MWKAGKWEKVARVERVDLNPLALSSEVGRIVPDAAGVRGQGFGRWQRQVDEDFRQSIWPQRGAKVAKPQ